jgi:hypothetical protein
MVGWGGVDKVHVKRETESRRVKTRVQHSDLACTGRTLGLYESRDKESRFKFIWCENDVTIFMYN